MIIAGIVFLGVATIVTVITRLYVRASASSAIVRTGGKGALVVLEGGTLVLPVLHEIVKVSLETLCLKIERMGKDALLTADNLRADIEAEFYIRVQANDVDVKEAARSLGDKTGDENAIRKLIENKLVDALRSTAVVKTLAQLNTERESFVKQVQDHVQADLKKNGFTLESATISKLDQSPMSQLSDDNIFDAQGKRAATEIVETQRTARNQLVRTAEQTRLQQDVEAKKRMLTLQQEQTAAETGQAAEIARIRAENDRSSAEAQIKNQKEVQLAQIAQSEELMVRETAKERASIIASTEKEKAIALAVQEKEKSLAVAQQDSQRSMELAVRDREISVAQQDAKLAGAETTKLTAEKARASEQQAIETVVALAEAEREQQKAVISAKATAEQAQIAVERKADAEAYTMGKAANAKKDNANAEAEAIRARARAESDAATMKAEGDRAAALIPVDVKAREVDVERSKVGVEAARVEVEKAKVGVLAQELEVREKSGKSAQEFELSKLRIVKEAEVRVEMAHASAKMFERIDATIYGSPADLTAMREAFTSGGKYAQLVEGFIRQADPAAVEEAKDLVKAGVGVAAGVIEKVATVAAGKLAPNGKGA